MTGNGVDPPSYLLMQKRLLKRALVRPAKSTTSESRLATRSSGARHLRFSDATLALSAFAARRARRRFRLHFFGLVAPSARITRPATRSSAGSSEQCLHPQAGGASFNVARTAPMAHSTPASESSGS